MSTTYIKTEMGEERMKERSELETVMCHRDGLSRLLSPEGTQIERAIPPAETRSISSAAGFQITEQAVGVDER